MSGDKKSRSNYTSVQKRSSQSTLVLGTLVLLTLGILTLSILTYVHLIEKDDKEVETSGNGSASSGDSSSLIQTTKWNGKAKLTSFEKPYRVDLATEVGVDNDILRKALQKGDIILSAVYVDPQDLTVHIEAENYAPSDVGIAPSTAILPNPVGNVNWSGAFRIPRSIQDPGDIKSLTISGKSIFYLSMEATS